MRDELVSLRLALIGAEPVRHELWRQGVALSGIPVEFSLLSADDGIAFFSQGAVDVCVINGALPAPDIVSLVSAARAIQPAPLIFVVGPPGCARPEGIDGMFISPSTEDEARKLAEICVRARIPTRVLIVDDSGTMRSIVRKILFGSRFALDLHETAEGFTALEQLRTGTFGLVFLDYNMPGLNGIETLSEMKREYPDVAVVMMTSTLDEAIAERAHAAGALAFLKKPFYPADIDRLLERYYGL